MNVGTIVVFQRDGRCQVWYRETDSEPFRALETEEAVTREALREMWKRVLYDLQVTPDREPFRLLLCTDCHREGCHGMFPDLGCPRPWSRRLLEEAMSQGPCAEEWSVNGEILSPGDFREVFPCKSGEKPMYVYTVPKYRMPMQENAVAPESLSDTLDDGAEYDALSVLAELLRETHCATETALEQDFDMMEVMREVLRR